MLLYNHHLLSLLDSIPHMITLVLGFKLQALGLKRKIQLHADISPHIINPMVGPRTRGIGFKIFQTAQMILINNVKNIVGEYINITYEFVLFIRETRAHSRIDQGVSRCACFRIISQVRTVLGGGICGRHFYKSIN